MPDPDRDILDLIETGRKIEAIKLAREHLGMGLAEARDFVEGLAGDASGAGSRPPDGDLFDDQIDSLLRAKKKIAAVKLYRDRANCQLKDAKDAVELRAVALGLQSRPSKCFIATAACGGGEQADVMTLRRFRNQVLRQSCAGRVFIAVYETVSPPLAAAVGRNERLAALARAGVGLLARACRRKATHR
jgi:ribosomal protein L7/L12